MLLLSEGLGAVLTQAAVIRQSKGHAVVCTPPFPSAVVSRLKRMGAALPLYTVITIPMPTERGLLRKWTAIWLPPRRSNNKCRFAALRLRKAGAAGLFRTSPHAHRACDVRSRNNLSTKPLFQLRYMLLKRPAADNDLHPVNGHAALVKFQLVFGLHHILAQAARVQIKRNIAHAKPHIGK